ncbi:MAG: chromate resistance protein [Phycisphaerales bacterium]|nr:chromate resistance protein [Phycisphaerales bacterium]
MRSVGAALILVVLVVLVTLLLWSSDPAAPFATGPESESAPTTARGAELPVYRTSRRLEPDTAVAAWLLTRMVSPGARALVAESWPGSIPFDEPGAELARRPGRCAARIIVERFGLHDPFVEALVEVVQELEIAPWSLNSEPFFERVRFGLGDALNTAPDPQSCLDAALQFLDELRAAQDALPGATAVPPM